MNEHLKQFARQAKIPEYHLEYGTELCIAPHLEKFAELLVRECMNLCKNVEQDDTLIEERKGSFVDGAWMCRDEIKEHFGVEE